MVSPKRRPGGGIGLAGEIVGQGPPTVKALASSVEQCGGRFVVEGGLVSRQGGQWTELSDDGWCGAESFQALAMDLLTLRAGAQWDASLPKG